MAGTTAALGVLSVTAALAVGLGATGTAAAWSHRLAGTADAAALAAADALSGAASGVPCERADQVAATMGAHVARCDTDDLVVTVVLVSSFGPLPVTAAARAGPAP